MIVYVAAPYSNIKNKKTLMNAIAYLCGKYMLENPGAYTITGLVHHYACLHHGELGTDWKFWKDFCEQFLTKCDKLLVLTFEGWKESGGVQAEIELAKLNGIEVEYVWFDEVELMEKLAELD